jgi:hypothetical protein
VGEQISKKVVEGHATALEMEMKVVIKDLTLEKQ